MCARVHRRLRTSRKAGGGKKRGAPSSSDVLARISRVLYKTKESEAESLRAPVNDLNRRASEAVVGFPGVVTVLGAMAWLKEDAGASRISPMHAVELRWAFPLAVDCTLPLRTGAVLKLRTLPTVVCMVKDGEHDRSCPTELSA